MTIVGYARSSKRGEAADAQRGALAEAGAARVFMDHTDSILLVDRPEWLKCLDILQPGDILTVCSLDQIAGSEVMAIQTLADLHARRVDLRSLTEPDIDTTTPVGGSLFSFVEVVAQLRSNNSAGEAEPVTIHDFATRRVPGRRSVMTPERTAEAIRMSGAGHSQAYIGKVLGVGASSVGRALSRTQQRVFLRDTKPYFAPESLAQLVGPTGGRITLPPHVHWGPELEVDLDTFGGTLKAYETVLQEGTPDDQKAILNRDRLVELWSELVVPPRVRSLWEGRFPALVSEVHDRSEGIRSPQGG